MPRSLSITCKKHNCEREEIVVKGKLRRRCPLCNEEYRARFRKPNGGGAHGGRRTVGVGHCGALVAGEDEMVLCGEKCEQNPFALQVRCWRHIGK